MFVWLIFASCAVSMLVSLSSMTLPTELILRAPWLLFTEHY